MIIEMFGGLASLLERLLSFWREKQLIGCTVDVFDYEREGRFGTFASLVPVVKLDSHCFATLPVFVRF
nr:hypothetical protein [Tanacetum cinerariifolium]